MGALVERCCDESRERKDDVCWTFGETCDTVHDSTLSGEVPSSENASPLGVLLSELPGAAFIELVKLFWQLTIPYPQIKACHFPQT